MENMSFCKNGIITSPELIECNGVNLVQENQRMNSYTYTPAKDTQNSCMSGYVVDFTGCTSGEKIHVQADIDFSGFDSSSTAGTFNLWFQGSVYKVESGSFVWEGNSGVNSLYNGSTYITSILTSKASGTYHFDYTFNLSSNFPATYSKQYVGFRSDYSNGVGKITLRNLIVTRDIFYAKNFMRSHKDFVAANDLMEI